MLLIFALAVAGGCGGEYVMTAPDVPALPGEDAPVVVRLQRQEFWFYWPPINDAAVTFRSDGHVRCARTDKHGYAAAGFPAPDEPGVVRVALHHQDSLGYTVSGQVHVFALSPDRPVAAVDMDSRPAGGKALNAAAEALGRIARKGQMIYLTQDCAAEPGQAHGVLDVAGLPPGPVVPWRGL